MLLQAASASTVSSGWYDRLTVAYSEPQRHYHNRQHIAECLAEFDQARYLAKQPISVELAIWFHDAVYDPKAGDNEERSAALAKECLRECTVADALAGTVSQLIMITKHHELDSNADAGVMMDVDLSIFGRDEKRFFEYEEKIRREYAWVPPAVFGSKRAAILQSFLARPRIFATELFFTKYEQQARFNLEASVQRLKQMSK